MFHGQVVFRSLETVVYKSACIAEADIGDFFHIVFQAVDQACFYINIIFVQCGEVALLRVSPKQGVSVFRFRDIVDAAVRLVSFHHIVGSTGIQT